MFVSVGSLNCKKCNGDQSRPAWYVDDQNKTCCFYLDLCSCTGKSTHRPGERWVTEEEYDRLKLLWAKPASPKDESFQVAA